MDLTIVTVPYANDVARWGAARGPNAILDAGLIDALRAAGHSVDEPIEIDLPRDQRTRDIVTNLGRIAARTSRAVGDALENGRRVIVLEGDCTHAVGAAGGLARISPPGVVWFDAHGDMNTTSTTLTGLWGGMPYAVILGWDLDDWRQAAGLDAAVKGTAAVLIGGSDLDDSEAAALQRHAIGRLDAADMMGEDAADSVQNMLGQRRDAASHWYLHIDLDVAGPEAAPGGLTPAPHWPPRERLIEAVHVTAETLPVSVVGLAAYSPGGDPTGRGAHLAIDLALAAVSAMLP